MTMGSIIGIVLLSLRVRSRSGNRFRQGFIRALVHITFCGYEERMGRREPIFNLATPLLFAHRGGAREAPESTPLAFFHALENAGADVLELDVQLAKCGEFVVWHGPGLSNVRIEGQNDRPRSRRRNRIDDYEWHELDGKAWVADPAVLDKPEEDIDLSAVPRDPGRCLLTLSSLLEKFPAAPLNIDMKKSFARRIPEAGRNGLEDNIRAFLEILDRDPGKRSIVVVSADCEFIREFRKLSASGFPTGLCAREQLLFRLFGLDMQNRAFETSYHRFLSGRRVIEKVRAAGGSTFVFLTAYGPLLPAMDEEVPRQDRVFEILDRGVDGIMTDRPRAVREMIRRWEKGGR